MHHEVFDYLWQYGNVCILHHVSVHIARYTDCLLVVVQSRQLYLSQMVLVFFDEVV